MASFRTLFACVVILCCVLWSSMARYGEDMEVETEMNKRDEGVRCTGQHASSFCLNGGTCRHIASLGEYYCICPGDYTGHRCDQKSG
uniref:OMEGA-stichotoxin-Shd4a n=1 Tax=Stichodactyla haddoni TaxID=475174 RepID=SHTX5_STIHA|nr:RecName: Full=OMEGA-stichotoxin-Shd4a; Short=OMEGA-SHTX-Shd4a; AltName: Full=EGF-like peptide SHTX V; AltName: Full=SHTX-5; Flags: Precursor [Stichodactyla haddoni]BAG12826.1 epidermal growth factor-like peptide [Stichodactyla haddoni]